MRKKLFYIFFLFALLGQAQTVFSRVRKNISQGNPVNDLFQLDSCYNKNYFKDSALFYKTLVNLKINKVQSAKKTLKMLAKLYPDFKEIHYLTGLIYFSDENYGKSVTEFNLAEKDNPNNIKAIYNRSVAFGLLEEYLAAIEDLNRCIEINPDYELAHYSRAYWHEFTGNYTEAAKDYESTLRLDPGNYDAYYGLAYVYQTQKETVKACETVNRAIMAGSQIAIDLREIFCK